MSVRDTEQIGQLRLQIAHGPRAPVKRHREPVSFVPDPLEQQEGRIVGGQSNGIGMLARVDELFLLGKADRDETSVGGGVVR